MNKLIALLFCIGCSNPVTNDSVCLSGDITYIQSAKSTSGFCPDIPDVLISITDGIFPLDDNNNCQEVEQVECTVHQYSCKYTTNNCDIYSSTTISFTDDGLSGSGFLSVAIICDRQFNCAGTYDLSLLLNP